MTRRSGWSVSKPKMPIDAGSIAKSCSSVTGRPTHRAASARPNWPCEKSATLPVRSRSRVMSWSARPLASEGLSPPGHPASQTSRPDATGESRRCAALRSRRSPIRPGSAPSAHSHPNLPVRRWPRREAVGWSTPAKRRCPSASLPSAAPIPGHAMSAAIRYARCVGPKATTRFRHGE